MNKAVLATICFALGAGFGFAVGYYVNKKESEAQDNKYVEPIPVEQPELKAEKKTEEP